MTNAERRPGGGAASSATGQVDGEATGFVEQLRRRRAASWRLPPLACGRRDPHAYRRRPLTGRELDAWGATVLHFADLGYDVGFAVPGDVRELLAVVR